MGTSTDQGSSGSNSTVMTPSATHERILRVLGITQRPLKSGELQNALGLYDDEAGSAFEWLTDHGYITSTVRIGQAAAQRARTFWSLADKGRLWAKDKGALLAESH